MGGETGGGGGGWAGGGAGDAGTGSPSGGGGTSEPGVPAPPSPLGLESSGPPGVTSPPSSPGVGDQFGSADRPPSPSLSPPSSSARAEVGATAPPISTTAVASRARPRCGPGGREGRVNRPVKISSRGVLGDRLAAWTKGPSSLRSTSEPEVEKQRRDEEQDEEGNDGRDYGMTPNQ